MKIEIGLKEALSIVEALRSAMQYIEPAALKNSAKGDEAWAIFSQMVYAQTILANHLKEAMKDES